MICARSLISSLFFLMFICGFAAPAGALELTREPVLPNIYVASPLGGQEMVIQNFPTNMKWNNMLARFGRQLENGHDADPRYLYWKEKMISLRGLPLHEKIEAVNTFINQARYVSDEKNWYVSDYWATPVEFFNRGGDCEDFVIAKFFSLRVLGVSDDDMRLAIVNDRLKGVMHAVLVVNTREGSVVLDNQTQNIVSVEDMWRYEPVLSFNHVTQWLHSS